MIKEQVVQIIIDHREGPSGLIDELIDYVYETQSLRITTNMETAQLEVADVIISANDDGTGRVGIERKSVDDFVDTVINPNRDMVRQMADLKRTFTRPMVILEGDTIFGLRGVSPEALRASMRMVGIGFGIPIIPTKSIEETAAYIVTIARGEQIDEKRKIAIPHTKRTQMTMTQRQEYVVSSIGSGVGASTAERLLRHFGSVRSIMNAPIDELCLVEGIGTKTAENILEVIGSEYKA